MNTNDALELRDLDAPPIDRLAESFVLPDGFLEDERVVAWYDEIVLRLRREAAGVQMNTIQQLLLERIAYSYAAMRRYELEENVNPRTHKDMMGVFQSLSDTFNRLLEKNNDKVHKENIGKIYGALNELLPLISDERERKEFQKGLIDLLAED